MMTEPEIRQLQVCGLDEAGRGPLAGPLVAAAVILPPEFDFAARFPGIAFRDSKTMSLLQREKAYDLITANATTWKIARIDVDTINANGIGWANRTIFEQLISEIAADYSVDCYIVDGNLKLNAPVQAWGRVESRVRADASVQAVSAAAILAKVTRDRIMRELDAQHPDYGWARNRGYGTAGHIAAIRAHGRTAQHRTVFVDTALSDKSAKATRKRRSASNSENG
jgi:ribonuclease HII